MSKVLAYIAGILTAVTLSLTAHPVMDEYARLHAEGTLFPESRKLDHWREHTSERSIEFWNIQEREDGRITAIFRERGLLDGVPAEAHGVIMVWHEDGKPTTAEWALIEPAEFDLAVAGQVADVATTAIGLAAGFSEANPLGAAILPIKVAVHYASKDMDLRNCVETRTAMGAIGWGAAAANIAVLAGAGPAGLILGIIVSVAVESTVRKDAPLRCQEK